MAHTPLTLVAHLELPADARFLAVARLALAGVAAQVEMADGVLEDLKFAVSEAVANAIQHGYDGAGGSVEVRFALAPQEIEITVCDHGRGFDPAHAVGGIGLAAMRALCPRFELASEPGAGTRVTFAGPLPA